MNLALMLLVLATPVLIDVVPRSGKASCPESTRVVVIAFAYVYVMPPAV
jgi:hypothetical protein